MKIFITGGTGFIGRNLVRLLVKKGHSVFILTRRPGEQNHFSQDISLIEGNPTKAGPWQKRLQECDAVYNLAGASIFQRWTQSNKQRILDSRILTTRNIVNALLQKEQGGTHLLNASAIGYYGFHQDEILDENEGPGIDFLAGVTKQWEAEAQKASDFGARVVLCRFGIVLGQNGGAFSKLLPIFRSGFGSQLGDGKQWFSWIHEQDLANILLEVLVNSNYEGPVNCTTPRPVQNKEMTKILAGVLKRPTLVPFVPGFMLRILLGEFADSLLKGQRVVPKKLEAQNFSFLFPRIQKAFENLLLD